MKYHGMLSGRAIQHNITAYFMIENVSIKSKTSDVSIINFT